jgi:2-aminoethylphosphonate-pyruvate transaminase
METSADLPLFTPGPLTTSRTVKQAMLRDLGSRDPEFISLIARVRTELLAVAGVTKESGWECVPMQGSGTFGIESVISTVVPRDGVLVVASNGAYGRRMVTIGKRHGMEVVNVEFHEEKRVEPGVVREALRSVSGRPALLACVHCETTTGLTNPIDAIGEVAREAGAEYMVDSMSGFGALPVQAAAIPGLTWVVSSSNKCVEGVPGLSFAIGRRSSLAACDGRARTLALDIQDQWKGLESDGQFRFTPPTHVLLALDQALAELKAEGGPARRLERYGRVQRIVVAGLRELGYRTLLPDELLSPIITSFRYPETPAFDFARFSRTLRERGYVIYPGKVSNAACFRVGSIGRLRESDAEGLVRAIGSIS